MLPILEVIRKTSLFFQPQIRTKIMNEGWASYWHEVLFLSDDRIKGHEVDFARVNAGVTAMPRVGLNPYALGMRLFYFIEEMADKGKYSFDFQRLSSSNQRRKFDKDTHTGRDFIFKIRENLCDFSFIHSFLDQDFVNKHKLFVAGKRLNPQRMAWQYYVKSRKAEDYSEMVKSNLYHPPDMHVEIKEEGNTLYLNHRFEGKPLVKEFIANTMMGVSYLWGGKVQLETSEVAAQPPRPLQDPKGGLKRRAGEKEAVPEITWQRMLYTMQDKELSVTQLS
jgi:stage V sporulation protein R